MALPRDSAAAQRPDCGGRRSDPGNLRLLAVRPAPALGETTRIMFADPGLGESESRAIFVDPIALRVKGDMTVYGTSGILPLRQWIDYAHRSLLLGDSGRLYSELAASSDVGGRARRHCPVGDDASKTAAE